MKMLIAGAGGPLGRELVDQYLLRGDRVTALVLREEELKGFKHPALKVIEADVTRPDTLDGVCRGMDAVISCLGITRIRGRLTHDLVDYRGNLNLLREAGLSGRPKFGFISPAGTDRGYGVVPLMAAKYRFETALRESGLPWLIHRSGGFFPDLGGMVKMAARGPLYAIGDGAAVSTPIHVPELASMMIEDMNASTNSIIEVGGPEDLSWLDVCRLCFEVQDLPPRIVKVPVGLCRTVVTLLKPFSTKYHAMGELLLFMATHDVRTPRRGRHPLRRYLTESRPVPVPG